MAQTIIFPLIERGKVLPKDVFAVVGHPESVRKLSLRSPTGLNIVASTDSQSKNVWSCKIQLLAIKPQQLDVVASQLPDLKSNDGSKPLLISLLAGVTLQRLQKLFPEHVCVRAVPNTPAMVGAGLTGLAWGGEVDEEQSLAIKQIFSPVSEVFEVPENQLDAFLALTSSGPAYVALMAEAMADGAVAAGLSRSFANHLAHRTLAGTASLLQEKELHPAQLKDKVASPGGTTIAALRHLEKVGLRSALIEAVVIAAERSRELAGVSR